jgi:chromosome segregation ATPase
MKTNTFMRAFTLTTLLAVAALPMACKTTEGHDRAAATADQVVSVGGVAGQTQLHLDNTLSALDKIVATAKQDPKPAFDAFVKSLGSFKSEFADLAKQRASLKSEAESWFTEFSKQNDQISDEDMKKAGAKRLADYREQVGDISKQVDDLMASCTAVSASLEDLRKFLGNDLSPKGIDAASDKAEDCGKDGRKVAAGLGKLSKSSEALASKLRANR